LLDIWLRDNGRSDTVEEIDHETLAQFLSSPSARERADGRTKKATTANALRTSLRTFFKYCHDGGSSDRFGHGE
jgi:site-specific recombinase XerD